MKNSPLQITLSEMQTQFSSPRMWGGIGIAALILGLSGPFQTFELLPIGQRLAYWTFMTVLTFLVGSFFGTFCSHLTEKWNIPGPFKIIIIGVMAGLPVAFIVTLVNTIALNFGFNDLGSTLLLAGYSIGISIAIVGMFELLKGNRDAKIPSIQKAPILQRLPIEKRGDLIYLSVQDHYVEVVTTKGKHLLLMRLGDAIGEAQGVEGLQIHRSHWVALDAIKNIERSNGKVCIRLDIGSELPVSRTYVATLKKTGLLI